MEPLSKDSQHEYIAVALKELGLSDDHGICINPTYRSIRLVLKASLSD